MPVAMAPRIGIFCTVFRVEVAGRDHVIVRSLRSNADLQTGNHWVAAVPSPRLDRFEESFRHPPCDGRLCAGGAAGHCVGLLRSAAAAANLAVVATTANGDCAFDTMSFWEGGHRDLGVWKRLRIELSAFMLENLDAEHWLTCFESCGEYDPSQKQGAAHLAGAYASGPQT